MSMEFKIPHLPPQTEIETKVVLKQLAVSHRYLAELKGISKTIPNENILIDTLILQEAKDSSEIENIVTTHDEIYKSKIDLKTFNPATKEVMNYAHSLKLGFQLVRENKLLLKKHILEIQKVLENNSAGFRTQAGTTLKNQRGEIIYTPPQHKEEILDLMANLERFINDDTVSALDPLVKMAVIHYQFETIHPFYDGNGRTGRIINILYLILKGLLDIPVLYLSRYITQNKAKYYQVLQGVRTKNDWENMILYLLKGVEVISRETIDLIDAIKTQMAYYKKVIRWKLPKIYSQDLLNNLFRNPYTKIAYLQRDLGVSRQTASNYLEQITNFGLLDKVKKGKTNYYVNKGLINIKGLIDIS